MTAKQPLSVEYLTKTLAVCWPADKLAAAAKEWPDANPTWAWWLGDRLASMPRADALERVSVAISHIHMQRLSAPARPGELWQMFKHASDLQVQVAAAALGAWLDTDSPDAGRQVLAALRGELGAATANAVIEAAPSSSSDADTAPPATTTTDTTITTTKRGRK